MVYLTDTFDKLHFRNLFAKQNSLHRAMEEMQSRPNSDTSKKKKMEN